MSKLYSAFISGKGGSGATTLLLEIAHKLSGLGVTVVDGDLSGRRGVAVILDAIKTLDDARAESKVPLARVDDLDVLELAESLDAAFILKPEIVEKFLEATTTPVVLIDAPQPLAAAVRPFITRSSRLFMIVEPNLLGVTGARSTIAEMSRFGIPETRLRLVVNQRGATAGYSRSQIERALGIQVAAEIPQMTDRGFGKAIEALARTVKETPPEQGVMTLRPSTQAPIGDRRSGPRRPAVPATTGNAAADTAAVAAAAAANAAAGTLAAKRDMLKAEIHQALGKRIDLIAAGRAGSDARKLAELRAEVGECVIQILSEKSSDARTSGITSAEDTARLRQEVIDEALGFGPLEELFRDPTVSEVMVNGYERIFVERGGKVELTSKRFADNRQVRLIIDRIIAPLGRRIDESTPMVDARLPDGSRVNAVIEPVAIDGPSVSIRRFGVKRLTIEDLINLGALVPEVADFLRACVEARLNIIISGGTGSGKTTFLNILSSYLPNDERIVTIEDAAELQLHQQNLVRLEARPANIEGRGEIRIRDLVRNALRMRPDRIIVGECRSGEAFDMLQAMNTGHDGSLTTVHANAPRDALTRIETMVLMAGMDLPVRAIRDQVASAIDLIIQTSRLRDGSRKIVSVAEVVGMEGDVITMQEIITYAQRGVDKDGKVVGSFQYSGVQPNCLKRFAEIGVTYDYTSLSKLEAVAGRW